MVAECVEIIQREQDAAEAAEDDDTHKSVH